MLRAMPSRAERYVAHLDTLTGGAEPRLQPIPSTHDGLDDVIAFVYADEPEPRYLTGVTYGLSLADHADWHGVKPELWISVRSDDPVWALAIGYLAEQLRGACPFVYGDTIDFGQPIAPESAMTAFAVSAPAALDAHQYTLIDIGGAPISIAGCYPVHDTERKYIREHGIDAFWQLDWDLYDVRRPPVV
jgi:hypothetical protein